MILIQLVYNIIHIFIFIVAKGILLMHPQNQKKCLFSDLGI